MQSPFGGGGGGAPFPGFDDPPLWKLVITTSGIFISAFDVFVGDFNCGFLAGAPAFAFGVLIGVFAFPKLKVKLSPVAPDGIATDSIAATTRLDTIMRVIAFLLSSSAACRHLDNGGTDERPAAHSD